MMAGNVMMVPIKINLSEPTELAACQIFISPITISGNMLKARPIVERMQITTNNAKTIQE